MQISIQAAVVVVVAVVGIFSTITTGRRLLGLKHKAPLPNTQETIHRLHDSSHPQDNENSLAFHVLPSDLSHQSPSTDTTELKVNQTTASVIETTSLLETPTEKSLSNSTLGYGATQDYSRELKDDHDSSNSAVSDDDPSQNLLIPPNREVQATRPSPCSQGRSFRTAVALLCCSTYFSVGATLVYVLTSSDFVGKAIYNGDPEAPSGSDGLARSGLAVITVSAVHQYTLCVHISCR